MNKKSKNFIEFDVFSKALRSLPSGKTVLINTINQYSYCLTKADTVFKKALQYSDVLLPDGIGVVLAVRILTGRIIKKIAGAEIHRFLIRKLKKTSGSCFYMGSSENTLQKIRERLAKECPGIRVGTYSPPFKARFTAEDNNQIIEAINAFKPDVLFIGMTAPKQEIWAYRNKKNIDTTIICTIGAVFDFYAGTVKRPGAAWINLGLEWLGRLLTEPKRMWKRYLYYGPIFLWAILVKKVRQVFA